MKKQIDAKIQVTLKHAPARIRAEDEMQITKPNYKLTLLAPECVFHKFCYLDYFPLLLL